jgi:hypothetical protein
MRGDRYSGATVMGSDVGGAGRGLRSVLLLCVAITAATVAAMAALATGSWLGVAAVATSAVALSAPAVRRTVPPWRAAVDRRRLRSRVGDPAALSGDWRRLFAAAWHARDEFSATVASYGSSPIAERLAAQQMVMDGALEYCGALARRGDQLLRQLRVFRSGRLRRELLVERGRDRHSARAAALTRRLDDVARLRADLDRLRLQLEDQVHDMRTAAWRASTLRDEADEPDVALTELLDDLAHLRAALAEVERPRAATAT